MNQRLALLLALLAGLVGLKWLDGSGPRPVVSAVIANSSVEQSTMTRITVSDHAPSGSSVAQTLARSRQTTGVRVAKVLPLPVIDDPFSKPLPIVRPNERPMDTNPNSPATGGAPVTAPPLPIQSPLPTAFGLWQDGLSVRVLFSTPQGVKAAAVGDVVMAHRVQQVDDRQVVLTQVADGKPVSLLLPARPVGASGPATRGADAAN